jgi:hypothetical protein
MSCARTHLHPHNFGCLDHALTNMSQQLQICNYMASWYIKLFVYVLIIMWWCHDLQPFCRLCENLYHMDELDNMDRIINTKKSSITWKKQIMFVRLIKYIILLKICCANLINHAWVKLWWHWSNWVNGWNQRHKCYWPCRWIQPYECWQFSYMNETYHFFQFHPFYWILFHAVLPIIHELSNSLIWSTLIDVHFLPCVILLMCQISWT